MATNVASEATRSKGSDPLSDSVMQLCQRFCWTGICRFLPVKLCIVPEEIKSAGIMYW